jgi:integrase/recombinase XerD
MDACLSHRGEESVMVKVLRSFVRGPLEPHVAGLAEALLRQGYTRS